MNKQRLFVTSCISIATAAMVFAIRGDIAGPMTSAFHITNEQMGLVFSPAFWAFTLAIFISGNLVDIVGMRIIHVLSALGFIGGVSLVLLAPRPEAPVASLFDHPGTMLLFAGFFMFGLSHGLVEGVINPLMATIYSDQKTKRIVAVHAWWPAGLITGGLVTLALTNYFDAPWQVRLAMILIPAASYLALALSVPYPKTERVTSNISTAEMWKQTTRPLFLILFLCMWMTAAVEIGPDQWFPTVMGALVPQLSPESGSGVLFLVYTAGLMFVLRMWGSGVSHKSPLGTLIVSSLLAGIGLYWLGALDQRSSAAAALAAATLFGVGKTFLWPTMIGVTAEQFPRGGALLLSLMGGAGMLSVGLVLPVMGRQMDQYGPGAALQLVAGLAAIMTVILSGVWLYFRLRGGYRAVSISVPARATRALALAITVLLTTPLLARDPLEQRIGRTDPSRYRAGRSHGSVGDMNCMTLVPGNALMTNLYFVHRCQITPGGGVGHHFHNTTEEMFVIFDGEAEFTVDGRTSLLKGTVGAPVRMGHSHAIYNPGKTPVEFMNINVSSVKGKYDAFDLDDARVGAPKDEKPVFMTMRLDKKLLRPMERYRGGQGTSMYRRALDPNVFLTHWSYVDHLVLPPGAAEGTHRHTGVEEVYYVIGGDGEVSVGAETAAIHKGDAVPLQLNDAHGFKNTGTQDLELMIIGVATQKGVLDVELVDANAPARGRGAGAR